MTLLRNLRRRDLLRSTIQAAALAATASLAACGGGATATTSSSQAAPTSSATSAATSIAVTTGSSTVASSAANTSAASAASATSVATSSSAAPVSNVATSASAVATKGATKVTVLTHWDPATTLKAFLPYVTEYQQARPGVTVEVSTVAFDQLLNKITVAQASGSIYDIYHIYDLWLAELVKNHAVAAAPQDVEGAIKGAYPTGAVDAVSSQGHLYGFPTEIDTYALNYNKRLFQEAGIADPPKTWAELTAAAQKLTKVDSSGAITQEGFGVITGWDAGVVHPWLSLLWSNGGEFLAGDFKKALFNSNQGLETIDLYRQSIGQKVTDPKMAKGYTANFIAGKTAMLIMANWWQSALQSKMKDSYVDVATAPIPTGPSGTKSTAVAYAWLFAVDPTSKVQPDAWQFLQWVNGPAAAGKSSRMGDWLLGQGILPSRDSDLTAHQTELGTPFLKPYVDALQTARPFPIVLAGTEITTDMQKQIEGVVLNNAAPKDALIAAETQINGLLQKNYGS